jgi:hypothetical protein
MPEPPPASKNAARAEGFAAIFGPIRAAPQFPAASAIPLGASSGHALHTLVCKLAEATRK